MQAARRRAAETLRLASAPSERKKPSTKKPR